MSDTSLEAPRTAAGFRRFPGISSRAWEHPADRAALATLRAVPGLDLVLRTVLGLVSERSLRLLHLASAVEVGPRQFPRVDRVYREVLDILDAPERWDLFVAQSPVLNAGAVGWDHPFIVLTSATVASLDDEALRVVLGHEVGHILSRHVLYKTMLKLLLRAGLSLLGVSLTTVGLYAILAALLEWDRKSELSADRASVVVAQDPEAVRRMLLRLAAGVGDGANTEAFREQAARYDEEGNALDGLIKLLAVMRQTHPFPVLRLRELDRWVETDGYRDVLAGAYPLREHDPAEKPWASWTEGAAHYADAVKSSADPVLHWMREAQSSVGEQAAKWFRRKGE